MYVDQMEALDISAKKLYELCATLYYIEKEYWVEEFEYVATSVPKGVPLVTVIGCFLLGVYTENFIPFFEEVVEEFRENFYFKDQFNEAYDIFCSAYLDDSKHSSLLERSIDNQWSW